jgi:hypothetical protein
MLSNPKQLTSVVATNPFCQKRRKALILSKRDSSWKFYSMWPSPKVVDTWVVEQWAPKIKWIGICICLWMRVLYLLLFLNKEEWDLIFKYRPYFMGSRGMYLSPWTLDFNPEQEITTAPMSGFRLPHLL